MLSRRSHKTPLAGSGHPWPVCVAWQGSIRVFPVEGTPGLTGLWGRAGLHSRRVQCSLVCTCPRSGKHWSLSCEMHTKLDKSLKMMMCIPFCYVKMIIILHRFLQIHIKIQTLQTSCVLTKNLHRSNLSWSPTGVTVRVAASPSVLVSVPMSKTGVWGTGSRSSRSSWASVHSDRVKEGWRLTDCLRSPTSLGIVPDDHKPVPLCHLQIMWTTFGKPGQRAVNGHLFVFIKTKFSSFHRNPLSLSIMIYC